MILKKITEIVVIACGTIWILYGIAWILIKIIF